MSCTVLSVHTDTHFNTPEPPPSSQPFPAPDSPFSDITPHGAPLAATHEVAIDPWLELWSPISTTSQSHEI